ncbi:hypothetical protein [Streptomyces sp. WM6378]|uniref:hypothetical protein n=1 Tax=Streptomyces sp. WM6378 TaxID=1415557 RepID=UPI00131C6034|nr:hypothetical protein [Streptomyces sp. WM6378]
MNDFMDALASEPAARTALPGIGEATSLVLILLCLAFALLTAILIGVAAAVLAIKAGENFPKAVMRGAKAFAATLGLLIAAATLCIAMFRT